MKKLIILDTNVSNPAIINTPPKTVEPKYPAVRIENGWPPSTIVQPPKLGSMVTFRIVPPVKMATILIWLGLVDMDHEQLTCGITRGT